MGHRLSKIYTRTGDQGTTGLGDGSRVEKDHLRVEAYGTVDEVLSQIGLLICEDGVPEKLQHQLSEIQHDLFDLGSALAVPGYSAVTAEYIDRLEKQLDEMNENLPWLKEFILPGGNKAAAICHIARTVCRRAERRVVTLAREEQLSEHSVKYLNRLSDWLFVAARVLARQNGGHEVLWERQRFNQPTETK